MNNVPSPIELIHVAAERLGSLREHVTFLGGAVVTLLVTEEGSRRPRPTEDVDVAIELASRQDFYDLEDALRKCGFQNVIEGPICRFKHGVVVLDIMPTDPEILGFSNRWYKAAIRDAVRYTLENEFTINLISPACFLATKMEAFDSPTRQDHGDISSSRDFEDVVTVIDGRSNIAQEILDADDDLRDYLQGRFAQLMSNRYWIEGIEAHLNDPGRGAIVAERICTFTNQSQR